MGRASRAKRERKNQPVPHYEVHAGLASATSTTGPEQATSAPPPAFEAMKLRHIKEEDS